MLTRIMLILICMVVFGIVCNVWAQVSSVYQVFNGLARERSKHYV